MASRCAAYVARGDGLTLASGGGTHIDAKVAKVRTTLDLPDPLLRQLKAQAALEGTTLKRLIREAIERGLAVPAAPVKAARARSSLPSIKIGHPLRAKWVSNATLAELLDK